jgi:hypothetical protein
MGRARNGLGEGLQIFDSQSAHRFIGDYRNISESHRFFVMRHGVFR